MRIAGASRDLTGRVDVPGDKSISHRAIMLASIAQGLSEITGLLEGADCLATVFAMRSLGAMVDQTGPGKYRVEGVGAEGLQEPDDVLDMGNSGTSTRLLCGLLAGYPVVSVLTGDASIRRRPMLRVVAPLQQMGATILGRESGDKAPLTIAGGNLKGIRYNTPVASAQVKSAILFAGLHAEGATEVIEPARSRDHSERMLKAFGANIAWEGLTTTITPGQTLKGQRVEVPGDFSSAAFFIVGALLIEGSELVVQNVTLNPTRTGLLEVLQEMGADVEVHSNRETAGEPVGDIRARFSELNGTTVEGERIPRMIDEFPILALAAAKAKGKTIVRDARELRVKESDRIDTLCRQLGKMGIEIEAFEDGFAIEGPQELKAATVSSEGDHRIAMTLAIAALLAEGETVIENPQCIETSFPGFFRKLSELSGGGG